MVMEDTTAIETMEEDTTAIKGKTTIQEEITTTRVTSRVEATTTTPEEATTREATEVGEEVVAMVATTTGDVEGEGITEGMVTTTNAKEASKQKGGNGGLRGKTDHFFFLPRFVLYSFM